MPVVSVFLPCYNAEQTLPEALESLIRQTFVDFELIAVDDGSSDATLAILQAWAARDARLRVLTQPHAGVLAAANLGLRTSQGRYLARMDADDRAAPERLARQVIFLDTHPEIDVVGSWVRGFPDDQVRQGFRLYIDWLNSLVIDADIRREMFIECPLANPSVLFRREIYERINGYEEHGWPEDYDWFLRAFLAGARFAKVAEYLLEWRESPQRLTRTDSRYSAENFLRAKAHYLGLGPLIGRDAVILWGAGSIGRRLEKLLRVQGVRLVAFVDIDPHKIGHVCHGLPVLAPEELPAWWQRFTNPVVIAAVGVRGARSLIRQRLEAFGLVEGQDWWSAA